MPRVSRAEGLSRESRFSGPGSFGPILRASRKIRGEQVVLHVASSASRSSRIGIAVTRRLLRSSVARNRVKRVVREVFRRHPARHAGLDVVVMCRAIDDPWAESLRAEIAALLDKAIAPR